MPTFVSIFVLLRTNVYLRLGKYSLRTGGNCVSVDRRNLRTGLRGTFARAKPSGPSVLKQGPALQICVRRVYCTGGLNQNYIRGNSPQM